METRRIKLTDLVLNEGQIAGELSKEELSQEKIMKCIMQHNNRKGE